MSESYKNQIAGYDANPNLKAANQHIEYTPEQIAEYVKCAKDPIHFIENHVHIVTLDEGKKLMKLYPFQKDIVRAIQNNRFVIAKLPRQSGKCLGIYTKVKIRNKKTLEEREVTIGELKNILTAAKSPT